MIFCTIPAAYFTIYSPAELITFAQSTIAGLLFFANFFYWLLLGDYFSPNANYQPFLHLWSLAVEEQSYLFFPFILISKYSRWIKFLFLSILTIASFLLQMWLTHFDSLLAFYMLPTRFWELAAGSLIAIATLDRYLLQKKSSEFLSLLGAGLIILPYGWKPFFVSFLGISPLILGVYLILAFARENTVIARFLSLKFMASIGLLSYSLYLWH